MRKKIKRLGDLQWHTGRASLRKYESSDSKILICGTPRHTCTDSTVTSKASLYYFSGRKVASWLKKETDKQIKSKKNILNNIILNICPTRCNVHSLFYLETALRISGGTTRNK